MAGGVSVTSHEQASRGPARAVIVAVVVALLLAAALASGGNERTVAQEGAATPATPVAIDFTQLVAQRPVEVRSGVCANPGETLAALTPLEKPAGEAQGQPEAIEAERAYSSIPLSLDALLGGSTNISILLNSEEDAVVIACGEIGGVVSEGGTLVVKLSEQNGSAFSGIAFLAPEDTGNAGVSLFVAGELTVAETRELAAIATPSEEITPLPEPTPTAEPVQVVDVAVTEWLIDMPAEVRAGQINIVVTNAGTESHGLVIEGQGLLFELPQPLEPGKSTILPVNLPAGEYVVYCPVGEGEHRAEGMEGALTVTP